MPRLLLAAIALLLLLVDVAPGCGAEEPPEPPASSEPAEGE